jgi:hypothetical protein
MPPRAPIRLLHALFPFWGLLWLTVALTASGLWLHEQDRWAGLSWGAVEMAHVAVGLVGAAVLLGYLAHHLVRHWGDLRDAARLLGILLAVDLLAASGTGLWLEIVTDTPPPGFVIPLHFWSTAPILPLLVLHTLQYVRRWLGSRA